MRHKWPIKFGIVALMLMLLVAVAACGSGGTSDTSQTGGAATTAAGTPQYGGILHVVSTAEGAQPLGVPWETLAIDTTLMGPCVETLVFEDSLGGIHPALATEWKGDSAAKTLTMTLRQGVKFHDGTDFNAQAAVWLIKKVMEAKQAPGYVSVEATGDYSIVITLDAWRNNVLNTLAGRTFGMISPTAFDAKGIEYSRGNPVGTGPFKFESLARGNVLKYTKNAEYWDKGKPYLDGVWFHFIRDAMTQQAALAVTGDESIDVLNTLTAEQAATLTKTVKNLTSTSYAIGPVSLIPDSANADSPFAKKAVREAVSYAIDREGIVAARGFGIWTPAYQYVPKGWVAHMDNYAGTPYDPSKAKQLLTEAGYSNGFSTRIIVMPGLVDKEAMVAVQSQLAAVGIKVDMEFPDSGGYTNYRMKGWTGLMAMHTRVMPNFNVTMEKFWLKSGGQWPSLQRSPGVEDAITASSRMPQMDGAAGQKVNKLMMDDMMIIPIYNAYDYFVMKTNVKGSGFAEWGAQTWWLPADTWISKN
jgi:peptide/nickel transport system substrate-binding protein